MTSRPGARLAGRPLHFILLLDASGSMAVDGKIEALNQAIRDAIPHLRDLASQNPFVEILVRAIAFSDGARWHIEEPSPIHDVSWPPVVAGGYTDLGAALGKVAEVLAVPPMESRAFPPVVVVVSDGRPTDDFEAGLERLMREPWGRRAVRLAIAIGADADLEVLSRFIGDPSIPPFTAHDPEQLAYLVRFVSTAASQLASSPAGAASSRVVATPDVPVPADGSLLVW
jgi:uncharacterized protein YegL